jgi:hypothetical protein
MGKQRIATRAGILRNRSPGTVLARLEAIRQEFGPSVGRERLMLLRALARAELGSAAQLLRLHEALGFARAYPDSAPVRSLATRMLDRFDRRADLLRHRRALADSGIAGTVTRFRFFAPTALRLARRCPESLGYDWADWEDPSRLEELLPLLAVHAETPGLDEWDLGLRGWLKRMKPPGMGDAAFVLRRLSCRVPDRFVFEKLVDGMDAPMILAPGRGTPSRSRAEWPVARVAWQKGPLRRDRPDLRAELARPPVAVRALSVREGERMVELAMDAMVTHQRDLDVFSYGDPRDVRLVDCGGGLQFAAIGALPERRLLLESVYGFLTLKNGVPTGYVLTSALFGSAEIAYNVFETFRGGEAAAVYGRVLAMTRHLFGADVFTVYPYQLGGAGNEEGLASGAWWFYRKLGFAPRHRVARSLMAREEARLARSPGQRSSLATLRRLGEHNVFWYSGERREDVMGVLPLANVGLAVTDFLARRAGGDADRGAAECVREAAALLGSRPGRGWSAGERLAFARWAPLALLLPGVARWQAAEKRALVAVMRAKGARRESAFVAAFDGHPRLRASVAQLARATRP